VTGVEARVIETTLEIRYSFQAAKNTSREVVATPGAASGRITRAKAPTGPQPSTRAASSSSQGISRKKVVSTKIASGSAKLMLGTTIAWYSSIQPQSLNSWYSGVTMATPGNIEQASTRASSRLRPRNRSRARASEDAVAISIASTVVETAMTTLLRTA